MDGWTADSGFGVRCALSEGVCRCMAAERLHFSFMGAIRRRSVFGGVRQGDDMGRCSGSEIP